MKKVAPRLVGVISPKEKMVGVVRTFLHFSWKERSDGAALHAKRTRCFHRSQLRARPLAGELKTQSVEVRDVHVTRDLDEPQLITARRRFLRELFLIHDGFDGCRHVILRGLVAPVVVGKVEEASAGVAWRRVAARKEAGKTERGSTVARLATIRFVWWRHAR